MFCSLFNFAPFFWGKILQRHPAPHLQRAIRLHGQHPRRSFPPPAQKTCKSCDHPRGGVGVIGFGYKVSAHPSQPNVMQQRIPRIARQGASPQTVPATRRATPGLHNTAPCHESLSNAVSLKDQKLCLPRGDLGHSHNVPHLQEA